MRNGAGATFFGLMFLIGCELTIPSGRYSCDNTGDCPPSQSCVSRICVEGDVDAGMDAAIPRDDGGPDAGPAMDSGRMDSGRRDAAGVDAGADGGRTDGGTDAGMTDAGTDAGRDSGVPDAGTSDPCSWGTFDGASHVESSFSITDVAHTAEAWIRVDPTSPSSPILSIGRLTFSTIPGYFDGDLLVEYTSHNALRAPSTSNSLNDGRWHHVAYTYTGGGFATPSNWTYWIDGAPYSVARFEGNASRNPLPTIGATTIGREPTESSPAFRYMSGDVREVRISSGVRYSVGFVPDVNLPSDGTTVALWRLGDIAAGTAPDSSGGGNVGAAMGVASASGPCPVSSVVCGIELVHTETGIRPGQSDWVDLDGDGDDDLAAAFDATSAVVYRNDRLGGFSDIWSEPIGGAAGKVRWGFLDSDANVDLAVGHATYAHVFAGTGSSLRSTAAFTTASGLSVASLELGDADGDGITDLYVGNTPSLGPTSRIYRGDGSGLIATPWWTDMSLYRTVEVARVDIEGDADGDFLVNSWACRAASCAGTSGPEGLFLLRNDGGSYVTAWSDVSGSTPRDFVLGDIDGDLDVDIVMMTSGTTISSYADSGSLFASTATSVGSTTGLGQRSLALGDFDGDGDLDLALARAGSGDQIWRNNGSGVFTPVWTASEIEDHTEAHFIDWDGDGDTDDLVVSSPTAPLRIYNEVCR